MASKTSTLFRNMFITPGRPTQCAALRVKYNFENSGVAIGTLPLERSLCSLAFALQVVCSLMLRRRTG